MQAELVIVTNMSDPTTRFSDRVADYVRWRPRYPAEVVALLQEETGLEPSWVVADVGSGTGFSTELFLDHGNEVYGVEPNAPMRAAAEALLGHAQRFHSVDGTAETTGLSTASVDLVVAGQAYHWFDPVRARVEFARILREPKWTVILWNRRLTDSTAFLRDYEQLLVEYGTDYAAVRHDRIDVDGLRTFFAGSVRKRSLENVQIFDYSGLEGRLRSSSYVPSADHPRHAPMQAALRRVFDQHQVEGKVRFEYETEIFIGRVGEAEGGADQRSV